MTKNENPEGRRGLRARFSGQSVRTRSVIAATGILVIGVTATGVAATGSPLLQGKRNGTATAETQVIANVGASNAAVGGYSTRQSNLSSTGGGAVYGCRSTTGGSNATPPTNPCIRANNLSTGYAFEFNASDGPSAGAITVGAGGDTKKPFTTNATGVATGLNADRVDGIDGAAIALKTDKAPDSAKLNGQDASTYASSGDLLFANVNTAGNVTGSRPAGATASKAGNTFTVTFAKDVSNCSFTATPSSATADADLGISAVSAGAGNLNKVTVDEDLNGAATLTPFSLQVIC
jgi:hypothetical protein